jgi:Zn-dependent protease with chaperone function
MAYRIGVIVVALTIPILPTIYLALIAAISYLLFLHVTTSIRGIAQMHSIWALFLLYVGPIVAGAILLFFMVKPFFARRMRSQPLRTLEFGEEPLLFALVTRIADAVGAPEPRSIAVDCQANASAGFGGLFGVLFGNDLQLTLGLPFAADLTTQQLAGVITHELGHFTQGAGMRLSFVVRSINGWFARVVYEQDNWDETLMQGMSQGNSFALILMLATICVWLTRRVLWLLMMISNGLSCFLLRQMEFDADRYECRLVGADTFAETDRRVVLVNIASTTAFMLAQASWFQRGKLPDDLGAFVVSMRQSISSKQSRKLLDSISSAKTGLFETHPSPSDRLANVRRETAPPVFALDGPATQIFVDFPKLSRAVTKDFYRSVIGKGNLKRATLIPVAEFVAGLKTM